MSNLDFDLIAIGLLVLFWMERLVVTAIQLKVGNKDKLLQKYASHVRVEGQLVFIDDIVLALQVIVSGFVISGIVYGITGLFSNAVITFLYILSFALSSLLQMYVRKETTRLIITDRSLIFMYGTWNNNIIEYSLDKISNVIVNQPLMGRIFHYGEIKVISTSGAELQLWNRGLQVKNPEEITRLFVESA